MAEITAKLVSAIWKFFPITISCASILFGLALTTALIHTLTRTNKTTWLKNTAMIFWLSPIYIWGLETAYNIWEIFNVGHRWLHPGPYQQLIFTNLYCLVVVVTAIASSITIVHGRGAITYLRGSLTRSVYMAIANVLVLEILIFILWFQIL